MPDPRVISVKKPLSHLDGPKITFIETKVEVSMPGTNYFWEKSNKHIVMETATIKKSLFERLGGRSGISTIVDLTVDNHMKNPAIKARFLPYLQTPERLALIKKHTVDFFSAGSGGPTEYTGRDMVATHTGMNINPAEYMHVIDDIFNALDKQSIDEETKKDVLAILWSLKDTIISK